MKCPICSTRLFPGTDRCPSCGYRPPASPITPRSPAVRRSRPRRRGCLQLPLMLLLGILVPGILALLGGSLIWSTIGSTVIHSPAQTVIQTAPYEDAASIPTAREGCFAIEGHTLTFLPDKWDGSPILRVPEYVDDALVTAIGPGCFKDCTGLTTIILPDSVTEIQAMAFSGCTELRGLYLPEGMESIGPNAFEGCVSLEAVCIPSTVDSIAAGCFDDCASLLYIFYDGSFEHWDALYDDYINPFTTAICLDGNYYHGAGD